MRYLLPVFPLILAFVGGCGSSSAPGDDDSLQGGADPEGQTARCARDPLLPDALGVKIPIPDDPALIPDAYFENTLYDSSKNLALWIPPGVDKLRGILYMHGSSNKPNIDNVNQGKKWRDEVEQDRRLAERQVASLWDFALLTGATWIDGANGYADQVALLDKALGEFATATNHPEIPSLPLVHQGGSRFSAFGYDLAMNQPERVIAFASIVGGINANEMSHSVPGLQIVGSDDGGQAKIDGSFWSARATGAQIGTAMMWGVEHICGPCSDLSWVYFDQVICKRVPEGGGALKSYTDEEGYLGNADTWVTVHSYPDYPSDRGRAAWLPDLLTANVWRAFTLPEPVVVMDQPTRPYSWSNGFTQDPSIQSASEPIEIVAKITTIFGGEISFFDGDQKLGVATISEDGKEARLSGVKLTPGIHSLFAMSGAMPVSRPAGLILGP
jgi:hypothetical protein